MQAFLQLSSERSPQPGAKNIRQIPRIPKRYERVCLVHRLWLGHAPTGLGQHWWLCNFFSHRRHLHDYVTDGSWLEIGIYSRGSATWTDARNLQGPCQTVDAMG
jgi:hypothetical protein